MKRIAKRVAAGAVVAGLALPAMAQYTPPSMTAVDFPIDAASIGTVVATAGATALLVIFGWVVGFRLIKAIMHRVKNAV